MGIWSHDFRPERITELAFTSDVPLQTLMWLRKAKESGGILHIVGQPGSGKSLLVERVAKAARCKVVEVAPDELDSLRSAPLRTLKGESVLVHLDEPEGVSIKGLLVKLRKIRMPVIITSTGLRIEGVETISIQRSSTANTMNAMKLVAQKVKAQKPAIGQDTVLFRVIAERAGGDIRAAINEMQLLGGRNIRTGQKDCTESLTGFCGRVMRERQSFMELERRFDSKAVGMCLASLLSSEVNWRQITGALLRCSEVETLPFDYGFLALARFYESRTGFKYVRDEYVGEVYSCASSDPHLFMAFADESENAVNEKENTRMLVYRYVAGSSSAVRRDPSLMEIIDL